MKVLRDLVGTTLSNRYRLLTRIAGGGMGDVYRGHDLLLDRKVAVKVLQPSLASDPELVQRFKQEARAAARLNHPNVVQVHDWGSERNAVYYMVMEYVAGTDLRDILVGRGPLEFARAAEIAACMCDALHAAHLTGLVHRDVKPENVLIARDGVVKVTDFGIAAVADAERSQPGGTILGTLRYLSPEQAAGQEATMASDIWAAGAVLFELLIGSPPQGGTGADLLRRRALEAPVAPSTLESDIPPEIDAIVVKACSLDPKERFATAAEMASALRKASPARQPVEELLADLTGEVRLPDDMNPTSFVARADLRKRRKGKLGLLRYAFFAVLLVAVVGGGVKAADAIFGAKEVQVPSILGKSVDEATFAADEAGFELEIAGRERHPTIPEGFIVSQVPEDGLLLEGRSIQVIVSGGLPLARVPSVKGMPLDEAIDAIEEHHLERGVVNHQFSTRYKLGQVMGQDPAEGRIEWGQQVYLVVSKGPRSVGTPSVDGLSAKKAKATLEAEGFTVSFVDTFSDEVPKGHVVQSSPAGGAPAPEGSQIQLFVSIGPEFKELTLPDVRGMSVTDATALLEGKNLRVDVTQSCAGSVVADTIPTGGSTVTENQTIALFVCG